MSWCTGGAIMQEIIEIMAPLQIEWSDKVGAYKKLIKLFENYDCDVLPECWQVDPAFDAAYKDLHPDAAMDF